MVQRPTLSDFDRMLDAADDRALSQQELDQIASVRAKVAAVRAAYHQAAAALAELDPIARRPDVARVRTVPSASRRGTTHTLRRVGPAWTCSCDGYRYRGRCRHATNASGCSHPGSGTQACAVSK